MSDKDQTKEAVSVSEMAHLCGLSRARFYQLQKAGVFPQPQRHPETDRPFYDKEQQRTCLEVRRRNCGVNGQTVLFYVQRKPISPPPVQKRSVKPKPAQREEHAGLLDGLRALGLTTVTTAQVALAVKELYPEGTVKRDDAEVIRAVFLRLRS